MHSAKILIVEDEKLVRWSLEKTLSKNGYEIDTAGNCTEALEISSKTKFNLLITDLRLPDGDGIEVAGTIKHRNPETKIILITEIGRAHV